MICGQCRKKWECPGHVDATRHAGADSRDKVMIRDKCKHFHTRFVRFGPHVAELCTAYRANTRGPGWFIPLVELRSRGVDPASLPSRDDLQVERQPSLWEGVA
jgi:hypothetical protein